MTLGIPKHHLGRHVQLLQMIESAPTMDWLQKTELELLQIIALPQSIELLQMTELLQIIELLLRLELPAVLAVVTPPGSTRWPKIVTLGSSSSRLFAHLAAANAFSIPAPPLRRPAAGMNVLVSWTTALTSTGFSRRFSSSSSATVPLTTAADMLVPESCMYAARPPPVT